MKTVVFTGYQYRENAEADLARLLAEGRSAALLTSAEAATVRGIVYPMVGLAIDADFSEEDVAVVVYGRGFDGA